MKNALPTLAILLVAGCSLERDGLSTDDATPIPRIEPAPQIEDAGDPSAPTTGAAEMLLAGGRFTFAIEESALWPTLSARCDGVTARDECVRDLRLEAAHEGLELRSAGDDTLSFRSYSGENTVLEATLRIRRTEGKVVTLDVMSLRPEGMPVPDRVQIEVVDPDRIAMDKNPSADPRVGPQRLVFHRTAD